jgi:hypothetical protein
VRSGFPGFLRAGHEALASGRIDVEWTVRRPF